MLKRLIFFFFNLVFVGSTAYTALGCDTLKKQQEHFDKVIYNIKGKDIDEDTQRRMAHGSENEINAMATLAAKVLPAYYPSKNFIEEGSYEIYRNNEPFFLVSPDGSIREKPYGSAILALEFKCPFPGKTFTTDIHYQIPTRYVPQILSEMAVMNVTELIYLSWTENSSTVFKVQYDATLWAKILQLCYDIYGEDRPKRPTRLQNVELKEEFNKFVSEKTELICEIPSVKAVNCLHNDMHSELEHFHSHQNSKYCLDVPVYTSLQVLIDAMCGTYENIKDSHSLTRLMCTEVLVWMLGDLYRQHNSVHALPVNWALKGYSLPCSIFRKMHLDMLINLKKLGIYTPVSCSDGQWAQLAIRSMRGEPLTLLQLQKDVYQQVKRKQKTTLYTVIEKKLQNVPNGTVLFTGKDRRIVSTSVNDTLLYHIGPLDESTLIFWSNDLVQKILKCKRKAGKNSSVVIQTIQQQDNGDIQMLNINEVYNRLQNESVGDDFLQVIGDIDAMYEKGEIEGLNMRPPTWFEVTDGTDSLAHSMSLITVEENNISEKDVPLSLSQMTEVQTSITVVTEQENSVDNQDFIENELLLTIDQYSVMLHDLQTSENIKVSKKFSETNVSDFVQMFQSASSIEKAFTLVDIRILLEPVIGYLKGNRVKINKSWNKRQLVNVLSRVCGDGSQIPVAVPPREKTVEIVDLVVTGTEILKSLPKVMLNNIYAGLIWEEEVAAWKSKAPFKDGIIIAGIEQQMKWYSQPEWIDEIKEYHFFILDAHHQLTNARYKVCSTGMPKAGISKHAWHKIAASPKNNTGLSRPMVEDIVDRQSSAFAEATFSEAVEKEMLSNGDYNEAEFCSLMRGFYEAVDKPGINPLERISKLLNLKFWLLKDVDFGTFPPFGGYVKDIPYVEYEGLLTGIDRRIQLYATVPNNLYNARSIGSLEVENFFSCFQDLHAAGTGIVKPKEVPSVLSSACDILSAKMDDKRYHKWL